MISRRQFLIGSSGLCLASSSVASAPVRSTRFDRGDFRFRVDFARALSSGGKIPVVMGFHGNGSDENLFATNAGQRGAYNAFMGAGFLFASARYVPNGSTWGAQASLDTYQALYTYLQSEFPIGPVVFYANSMGGIESLLCLAENRIGSVVGWIGHSPTYSLAANYAAPVGFTALINRAYGVTGLYPETYSVKTSGHDPALMPASAFRGVPMAIYAATDDVSVSKRDNADALYAKVYGRAAEVYSAAGITGGHSFSTSLVASSMVAHAKRWAGI